eukprot:6176882-Pleurochrysis_carterae.AAC.5
MKGGCGRSKPFSEGYTSHKRDTCKIDRGSRHQTLLFGNLSPYSMLKLLALSSTSYERYAGNNPVRSGI